MITWIVYCGEVINAISFALALCWFLLLGIAILYAISAGEYGLTTEERNNRFTTARKLVIFAVVMLLPMAFIPNQKTVMVAQIEYACTKTPINKAIVRIANWLDKNVLPEYAEKFDSDE